jgi:hypothetical protein
LQEIPPWPGLNRFKSVNSTGEFADGTKYEDFSKVFIQMFELRLKNYDLNNKFQVIVFASQHILNATDSEEGFCLLRLIRSYLELDMFASLTLQTESTIAAGREELVRFEGILRVCRFSLSQIFLPCYLLMIL